MKKRLIVGFFAILMALATIQGNELKTMAKINPGTGKAQTWLPSEDEPDSKFSDADRTLKEGNLVLNLSYIKEPKRFLLFMGR